MFKDDFITIARAHHLSPTTQKSYWSCIHGYLRRMDSASRHFEEHPSARFREFLSQLANEKISVSTQRVNFHAVRFFYEKVMNFPLGDLSDLPRAKGHQKIVQVPDQESASALVASIDGINGTILKTIYGTGARLSEILKLQIKDLDFKSNLISVQEGKGGKSRLVPLPKSLIEDFKALTKDRQDGDYLFPSLKPARHLQPITVQRAFTKAKRKLNLTKNYTVHSLRHAAAQFWERHNVPMSEIQALLGHAHRNTTSRYLMSGVKSVANVPTPI